MRHNTISPDQCKDTGLALILILLLFAWGNRSSLLIGSAIAALILTMTAPKLFTPLARVWFAFSHFLGEIVSRMLLTIVFFTIVTPVAFVRRLSGKDAMALNQWKKGKQSTFVQRDHIVTAADLEKPF